jgi:hypothetical protein
MRLALQSMAAVLQLGSAVFALCAARLWWNSAAIRVAEKFPITIIFGTGTGHSTALNELADKLREQSGLSGRAAKLAGVSAACAAFSALLQAILIPWAGFVGGQ